MDDTLADFVTHERFMRAAIDEAHQAGEAGDVPIGAVVVREWPPRENSRRGRGRGRAATDTTDVEREDREGVFVVEDGKARFTPVELGITGEEDFEVLSGLEADQPMVAGPFRVLRDLQHGDRVKEQKTKRGRE